MNPAVLNYMQSQPAQQNPQMQPQQSFNPFDSGIRAAIESARVSLDMTEKQQDKALRRSMLSFADAYGNEPKAKGFMGNFGAVARSLSPAIMAHDEVEDASFRENNDLANQILKYQAAEQARQAQAEERQWHRQHAENQLAEQQRYHNMMDSYHKSKLQQNEISLPSNLEGMGLIPIDNKKDFASYLKDKKSIGKVLHDIDSLEEDYANFRTKAEKNIFDPMGPGRSVTNKAKDVAGRFFNNKALKEETAERETLDAKLKKFVTSSERDLKGGGNLGLGLIKFFKDENIYPTLSEDSPETFIAKLKMMKEETENSYKAANLSLQHKVHLDAFQVHDFESTLSGKKPEIPEAADIENVNNETVLMQDQSGKTYQIPASEANDALQDGLVLVEG